MSKSLVSDNYLTGTRTGSYSFHSEKFRKSYGIFRNQYEERAEDLRWLETVYLRVGGLFVALRFPGRKFFFDSFLSR